MDGGYIFGAPGLPKTPQELAQMRAVAQALAVRSASHAPRNVGEGLSAIGQALMYRGMMDDAAKAQTAGNASAAAAMGAIIPGGAPASTPAPVAPAPAVPATPSIPPQALSPSDLSTTPAPMSGGNVAQNPAALTDAVAKLESGNSPVNGPAGGYANYRFQQFPAFAKQYGTGEDGVTNYAKQVLAANPNATFGDMYGGYVTGTGNPATANVANLQTTTQPGAQGAYGNLVRNSPIDPKTPLSQVMASNIASLLGPASANADTLKPGDTLLQQPQAPTSPAGPALAFNGTPDNPQPDNPLAGGPPAAPPAGMQPFTSPQNLQTLQTKPVTLPIAGQAPAPPAAPAAAAPAQSGPAVQALMKAAQNPWVMQNPGSAAIVKMLLQQQVQQQDPGRALDLQVKKAQLDNLINPDMKFVPNASHDQYGNAIGGFVDTKKGTVKLIGANGQPVPPGGPTPAPNGDVHGEEFLKTIDPGKAETVKGIAEGRIPYPSGFIMKTPYGQWLTQAVGQYEPGIDATMIAQRHKLRTDLGSSSPNSMGGIMSNGKSAFDHLGELSDRYAALGNYNGPDIPGGGVVASIGNKIGNDILPTASTKDKLQQAADNALKYGQEVTKFYAGTGGGEAERMNALRSVDPGTATSAQMAGYLETEKSLMLDRFRQKEAQIRDTLGPAYLQQHPVITPDLQQQIQRIDANIAKLRGQSSGAAPSAAAPAAPSLPQGWTVTVH